MAPPIRFQPVPMILEKNFMPGWKRRRKSMPRRSWLSMIFFRVCTTGAFSTG